MGSCSVIAYAKLKIKQKKKNKKYRKIQKKKKKIDHRSHGEQNKHQFRKAGLLHDGPFSKNKSERTAGQKFRARRCFRSNVWLPVVPKLRRIAPRPAFFAIGPYLLQRSKIGTPGFSLCI
jgi:hypothetical protein